MSVCALLLAITASAALPPPPCDAVCERRIAVEQLRRGEIRAAVARLREAVARNPEDPVLPRLLARGYLLDGNMFWAERTLRAALARQPEDHELRLWLACVHLREGDPDLAKLDLAAVADLPDGPASARKALLQTFRLHLAGDPDAARAALRMVDCRATVFPEDRPIWSALHHRLDHWWLDPITGEVEVGAGHTSNALAGAPTDPGSAGTASALADLTFRSRVAPPLGSVVRPVLDVEVLGHGVHERAYRELSYLQSSARLAATVTRPGFSLLAGYRAERLDLDESPSRYAQAHRGEIEIEWRSGLLAFAGGGHRDYRDERRTRREWDVGAGGPVHLGRGVTAVAGATVRGADAHDPAFDMRGASVAAAARIGLGHGISARVATTVAWEEYPHSGGQAGQWAFGTSELRRDLLGKLTLGVWAPRWRGALAGLEWQLARRNSTADDRPGFDFDYRESRVRVLLRWTFSSDPWAPRAIRPSDHVPMPWGFGRDGSADEERIIDLLRQDEELRRGSSCGV